MWVLAWLPLGLWRGEPAFVLQVASRGSWERQVYQGLLYGGLLAVFLLVWREHAPPRPGWGRWGDFARYAVLGLVGASLLRGVMLALGGRSPVSLSSDPWWWLQTALSAVAVALIEEAVFRGFLMGHLAPAWGPTRALVGVSLVFALVHLFRPGPWWFKACYALGLVLLAGLLGRIAWERRSLAASAGLHAGVIWPNLLDPWPGLQQSWWTGWLGEPVAGGLSWVMTAGLWLQWELWFRTRSSSAGAAGRDGASRP